MAHSSRAGSLEKPMNVEQIVGLAAAPQIDPQFSLQHYFRSAEVMVKQANIYEHEGNEQMAYFLLYRHAILVLDALPKHPEAKDHKYDDKWSHARKTVNKSLKKLEVLKPKINKRYERHLERRKALAAQVEAAAVRQPRSLENALAGVSINEASAKRTDESPSRLDPAQHRDMAVQLANREIGRRTRLGLEQARDEDDFAQDAEVQRAMQSTMADARRRSELSEARTVPPRTSSRQPPSSSKTYNYPRVDHDEPQAGALRLPSFTSVRHQTRELHMHMPSPQRPPKQALVPVVPAKGPVPPSKGPVLPSKGPVLPSKEPIQPATPPIPSKAIPSPPPSPTPAHQFLPSAYLENGSPLRTIFFPGGLRAAFLRIAATNTRQNLETCGILCGTLLRNAFFITKLVIPEQKSTSDTCEMINEEALHSYCDAPQPGGEELMVLGWIHTHPTQTAFMSSRDLHTHCWYQVQLPESIAVVCAPSHVPDFGIFRLTDPPGIDAIRRCNRPGIFHPHDETRVFTDANGRPGHVIEHDDLRFETVDLRPGMGRV